MKSKTIAIFTSWLATFALLMSFAAETSGGSFGEGVVDTGVKRTSETETSPDDDPVAAAMARRAAKKKAAEELEKARQEEKNARLAQSREKMASLLVGEMVPIPGTNFFMGRTEVTQTQWEAMMGDNPSQFTDANRPVECVSLLDVQKFLEVVNATEAARKENIVFRLPTMEEWKYAVTLDGYRPEPSDLDSIGWHLWNSGRTTQPVAQLMPTPRGLYDMFGNVAEWTSTESGGGSYCAVGGHCRDEAERIIKIGMRFEINMVGPAHSGIIYDVHQEWLHSNESSPNVGFRLCADKVQARAEQPIVSDNPSKTAEAQPKVAEGLRKVAEIKSQAEDVQQRQATVLDVANPKELVEMVVADMIAIPGKSYRMGKTEVTQAQWEAVMERNLSKFKDGNNPVERVSWNDCQEFLKRFNALPEVKKSGLVFRLPTEEEWEYACRAGATGAYSKLADGTEIAEATLGRIAWHEDNSAKKTHPVGQKEPNAFGLYDMCGNVWEWTQTADGWNRVYRGGGWNDSAKDCETSTRFRLSPGIPYDDLGFRLCASGRAD